MQAPSEAALQAKKRASAASQWGVYLMLFAMSTTDILRAPSSALRPHADGLGSGFSDAQYGSGQPSLQHLIGPASVAQQLGLGDDHDDEGDDTLLTRKRDRHDDSNESGNHDGSSDAYTGSSADSSLDDATMEIEDDGDCGVAARPSLLHSSFADVSPAVLEGILEYLPVSEINKVRSMSIGLGIAATRLCPQPLGDGITFVRNSELANLQPPPPNPHALPTPFYWRCVNCSSYSGNHEVCVYCGTSIRQSGCRVFMGQVRKQHTALALRGCISALCPSVNVLHIESHSNKDGYEKGAAWVYVDTPEQAYELVQLHKRLFFDCDNDGNEGYWYVHDLGMEAQLGNFAATRKGDAVRKEKPLPGQPLVVEFPATSMLRGFTPNPLRSAAPSRSNRDKKGWYHDTPTGKSTTK